MFRRPFSHLSGIANLLLLVLELLGEGVGLALEALCLGLVGGGVAHAGALGVGVGVVHRCDFSSTKFKLIIYS